MRLRVAHNDWNVQNVSIADSLAVSKRNKKDLLHYGRQL